MTTRTERNEEKQKELIREENRELRKKIVLTAAKVILIIIVISLIFYFYTTYISSKIITVKEERIINEKIPESFNGLKIIQISDIHYGTTIFKDDIANLVKLINERNPDLVIFTGDLINKDYKLHEKEKEYLIKQLKNIKSTLGKYAIYGEEDEKYFDSIMTQSQFIILDNSYDLIYKNSNTPILIVGINTNNTDLEKSYAYFKEPTHNSNIYTISLLHKPDEIDSLIEQHNSDLILAGHSHNGQIRIPKIGGIIKKDGAKKYINEYYKINNSEIYISSGIGTNELGFRLFCRPSINFFRISSK